MTITGGKLTTFRLMAEETVDAVCRQLGDARACTTASEPLPGSESGETLPAVGERLQRKEAKLADEQLICECELVPRAKLERGDRPHRLDQPRRHPPAAAARDGPVPGRLLHLPRDRDPARARRPQRAGRPTRSLLDFLQERWKGVWPVLYGDQLRQARLDEWIFQGVLDVEHLPS